MDMWKSRDRSVILTTLTLSQSLLHWSSRHISRLLQRFLQRLLYKYSSLSSGDVLRRSLVPAISWAGTIPKAYLTSNPNREPDETAQRSQVTSDYRRMYSNAFTPLAHSLTRNFRPVTRSLMPLTACIGCEADMSYPASPGSLGLRGGEPTISVTLFPLSPSSTSAPRQRLNTFPPAAIATTLKVGGGNKCVRWYSIIL